MNEDVVSKLSPGVKDLVVWLNGQGFETCDSGDGTNHTNGMGCAVPFPMVAIQTEPHKIVDESNRLCNLLKNRGVSFEPKIQECGEESPEVQYPQIQASYDPQDGNALIVLYNVLSKDARLGS